MSAATHPSRARPTHGGTRSPASDATRCSRAERRPDRDSSCRRSASFDGGIPSPAAATRRARTSAAVARIIRSVASRAWSAHGRPLSPRRDAGTSGTRRVTGSPQPEEWDKRVIAHVQSLELDLPAASGRQRYTPLAAFDRRVRSDGPRRRAPDHAAALPPRDRRDRRRRDSRLRALRVRSGAWSKHRTDSAGSAGATRCRSMELDRRRTSCRRRSRRCSSAAGRRSGRRNRPRTRSSRRPRSSSPRRSRSGSRRSACSLRAKRRTRRVRRGSARRSR